VSSPDPSASPRPPVSVPVRVLAAVAVVVLLLAGGWVAGGLISNDFMVSMLLTAVWVGIVGLACLLIVRSRREMWPVLAAFALTAAVAGAYLGTETLLDDEVDEDVVTASAPARAPGGGGAAEGDRSKAPRNVLLARGRFESLEHETDGVAQAIEVRGDERFLTLTRFETDNGPDLRVYLSTPDASEGSAGAEFEDLGALKGNKGDQQYEIPKGVDLDRLSKVLVWCRAFSVGFGSAELRGG
jgi:Electron transfer DM13